MTMNGILEKRSIQISLALVVALIWGYNAFTIMDITTDGAASEVVASTDIDSALLRMPNQLAYHYEGNFKDPFEPALRRPAPRKKKKPAKPAPPPVTPPNLTLSGVIEGTAILSNTRRELFFAEVGDSVEGARITAIVADSVTLEYKSKQFSIKL